MRCAICLLPSLLACASGTAVTGALTFDRNELEFSQTNGMTVVSLPGHSMTWEVGAPSLPIATAKMVVPQGMEVVGVRLLGFETEPIEGEFEVFPVQEPRPISSQEEPRFTPPDPGFYGLAEYPGKIATVGKQGMMFGYNIATVFVAPVQYAASRKKLVFHPLVEFSLVLAPNEDYRKAGMERSEAARARIEQDLGEVVLNPEDIGRYAP